MGRLQWQSSCNRNVINGGGQRPDHRTHRRGGGEEGAFFEEVFFLEAAGPCKKTGSGPTQTRKKALPPAREPSFSKITKPEKSTKVHPKWSQRRTLDAAKTHIEGALADGFHHIVALRPQAKEKCAKLCEKCPGKVPWAPKNEKQATKSAQTSTKMVPKSTK